jgi:hypothetical protein
MVATRFFGSVARFFVTKECGARDHDVKLHLNVIRILVVIIDLYIGYNI